MLDPRATRSETQLCQDVPLNLADRWVCQLGPTGSVRECWTFSKKPPWPLRRGPRSSACLGRYRRLSRNSAQTEESRNAVCASEAIAAADPSQAPGPVRSQRRILSRRHHSKPQTFGNARIGLKAVPTNERPPSQQARTASSIRPHPRKLSSCSPNIGEVCSAQKA